uniref:Uncharacterized protein n=1 Tax=Chenopodium quinoa TaxID=63459 RepID=A0A803M2I1_CHEQI
MARIDWGNHGRGKWGCSYKKITLIVCSINIVVALYVLHCLYSSVYNYSNANTSSQDIVKHTPDQLRRMEESVRIRKAAEPIELVKVVENFTAVLAEQKRNTKLPLHLKQMIRDEILQQLKTLPAKANTTEQRELQLGMGSQCSLHDPLSFTHSGCFTSMPRQDEFLKHHCQDPGYTARPCCWVLILSPSINLELAFLDAEFLLSSISLSTVPVICLLQESTFSPRCLLCNATLVTCC